MQEKVTKADLPEGQEVLLDQRDQFHKIRVLKESEGGKELIALTVLTVINTMRQLSQSDKDPLCATLKANLDMLALLSNAKENEDAVNELIKEALDA